MNVPIAELAGWAEQLAEDKLGAQVPRRWTHTQHSVRRARSISPIVGEDAELLVAAVAVHDIGHSPDLGLDEVSSFPLYDAVRYLEGISAPERLVALVANHALGRLEGELRGYPQMAEYTDEGGLIRDGLWFSCLTVGPDGQVVSFDERVREWVVRYADDEVMGVFTPQAVPLLQESVDRVWAAINEQGLDVTAGA